MKKVFAVVVVMMAACVVFAGDWFPVASDHPGEPVNVHVMHGGTTVQICPPRVERHHCHRHKGGIVGAVLGAVFGERCHYDYPQKVVVEPSPVVMTPPNQGVEVRQPVVAEPCYAPGCGEIVTPTYQKRVVEGHYIDNYVSGRLVKTWVPAREEWVRVR